MEEQSKDISKHSTNEVSYSKHETNESSSVAPVHIESQMSSPDSVELGNEIPNEVTNVQEIPVPSSTTSSGNSSPSTLYSNITSDGSIGYNKSLKAEVVSMVLRGCLRYYMYVMLQKQNPQCPRCKSSALVNLFQED